MKRGDKTSEDENVRWSEKFLTLNDFFPTSTSTSTWRGNERKMEKLSKLRFVEPNLVLSTPLKNSFASQEIQQRKENVNSVYLLWLLLWSSSSLLLRRRHRYQILEVQITKLYNKNNKIFTCIPFKCKFSGSYLGDVITDNVFIWFREPNL
jgi:hypothetical protein